MYAITVVNIVENPDGLEMTVFSYMMLCSQYDTSSYYIYFTTTANDKKLCSNNVFFYTMSFTVSQSRYS